MSFRKEVKIALTPADSLLVQAELTGKGMKPLHPERRVNSQYFDTSAMDFFHDTDEGVLPRRKIRVRWYDDDCENYALEEKISSVEGRFKTSEKIFPNQFKDLLNGGLIRNGRVLHPVVRVGYRRAYFLLDKVRVTFDRGIEYWFNRDAGQRIDFEEVMEMKTLIDCPDDYLETWVPYPRTRFSKYGRAFLLRDGII